MLVRQSTSSYGFCIATNRRCGGSEADRLPCRFAIQTDSGTLEEWTDWKLMRFNKDKCRSLTWDRRAPCSDRGWGSVVGKQLCGKGLRVPGGSWTPAMQADSVLGSLQRNVASKLNQVVVLYLTVKPRVEYCAWFSAKRKRKQNIKKDVNKLDWV